MRLIECDVDGVLLDIWTPVEAYYRERGVHFSFEEEVKSFGMMELGNRRREVLNLLCDSEIRKRCTFYSGSDIFIAMLLGIAVQRRYSVVLNTHERDMAVAEVKRSLLVDFEGRVGRLLGRDVTGVLSSNISIGGTKEMLNSYVVIDDAVPNLNRSKADYKLLFDRFHNRYEVVNGMQRVRSYEDVLKWVERVCVM